MVTKQTLTQFNKTLKGVVLGSAVALSIGITALPQQAQADETCQSPYMAKIVGKGDYV